jgi:integrase/recombinase XerD
MSPLRKALAGYLAVRRALGYQLARPEKLLGQFISYLEDAGTETITTGHALAWATLPGGNPSWHALRLSAVRGFATYLRTVDRRRRYLRRTCSHGGPAGPPLTCIPALTSRL